MKKFSSVLLIAILCLGILLFLVSQKNQILNTQKIKITASFYPLYDFAKNVTKDKGEVINITTAGSEPHDFDPTAQDVVDIQKSKLFIYNDVNLEKWTEKLLGDLGNSVVKASDGIQIVNSDPHVWLDPSLAQKEVENITKALIATDRENESYYQNNSQIYINKLKALDQSFKLGLTNCQTRDFIASHEAFGYLARRYNLNMISIAGFAPDSEPSPKVLANLSYLAKTKNIKYVFFESLVSPKLAQTLAHEINAKTLVLDPIEGLTTDRINSGEDYISLQENNLKNLKIALNCK